MNHLGVLAEFLAPILRRGGAKRFAIRKTLNVMFRTVFQDWFSRQQLVMLVLFINISLALMFFKLLT